MSVRLWTVTSPRAGIWLMTCSRQHMQHSTYDIAYLSTDEQHPEQFAEKGDNACRKSESHSSTTQSAAARSTSGQTSGQTYAQTLTCQGPAPAASRRCLSRSCSSPLSTNTGWPRTTSSPKLRMNAWSTLAALPSASAWRCSSRRQQTAAYKPCQQLSHSDNSQRHHRRPEDMQK